MLNAPSGDTETGRRLTVTSTIWEASFTRPESATVASLVSINDGNLISGPVLSAGAAGAGAATGARRVATAFGAFGPSRAMVQVLLPLSPFRL